MKRSFIVAQLGARMHYAVPSIFHEAEMLGQLFTDITAAKGWPRILGLIPRGVLPRVAQRLASRMPKSIPGELITAFTCFGWEYNRRQARCSSLGQLNSTYLWGGREFCKLILDCGFRSADGVYTFNTAGLEVLQNAKRRGLQAVMEQTIAPKRVEVDLLRREHETWPDWEEFPEENPIMLNLIEREEREWATADIIVCGSEFVRGGIRDCGGPVGKCVVVPYGFKVGNRALTQRCVNKVGPLRVLTVGAVGLRKGSPYVLEAAIKLKGRAVFRMVGNICVKPAAEAILRTHLELIGPVPRGDIGKHYEWADVFLLPSVCEGSATVTYEALAYGLPVICTPNAGSMVKHGRSGFIVDGGDTYAMICRLEELANRPDLRHSMSEAAGCDSNDLTLTAYGRRLLDAVSV